jgi:UrcA family protein
MNHIIAIATAALVCGSAAAASAQDDPPTARVSYADLDLTHASGRTTLSVRIEHAINIVCGERPAPMELDRMAAYNTCRTAARDSANKQLATVLGGARLADQAVVVKPTGR